MDVRGLLGIRLDLAAQPIDVGVDGARLDLDFVAPDPAQQFSAAHDLSGTRCEQRQEVELRQRQHHFLTIAEHLTAPEIDGESGELEAIAWLLLRRDFTAAKMRPDARHELANLE